MTPRGALAATLVLLVVLSSAALGSAATNTPGGVDPAIADGETADAVLVASDGDALFRFDRGDRPRGAMFIERESGLAYVDLAQEVGDDPRNATGTAELRYMPGNVSGGADIRVGDPAPLHTLDARLQLLAGADRAESTLEIDGQINRTDPRVRALVGHGTIETVATAVSGHGSLEIRLAGGNESGFALDERRNLTLTETDRGYDVDVAEERSVGGWERERWNTRARARGSLESRYTEVALGLGGEAAVTLAEYRYDDTPGNRSVTLAYRVSFTDVESGVTRRLAQALAPVADGGMDPDARRLLAERFADTTVEELTIGYEQNGSVTALSWAFELENADALLHAAAELGAIDRSYTDVRSMVEAREAARLTETFTWDHALTHDAETGLTHVDARYASDAERWGAYVTALEDRGLQPVRGETELAYGATLEPGEALQLHYDLDASTAAIPRFVTRGTEAIVRETANESVFSMPGANLATVDRLRMVTDLAGDEVSVEWGAAGAAPGENWGLPAGVEVAAVRGTSTDGGWRVSLVVPGAFPSDPDHSTVADHRLVGSTTDVFMTDDWARGVPAEDRETAREFLGLEETPDQTTRWMTIAVGGLGVGLLAGAVLLLRYRGNGWLKSRF